MSKQRGDTIVEVLFAVTVFSMVAVGGIALMNQGAAMAQRSLEIGLVRDQIDAQADALRYVHSAYIANLGQNQTNAPLTTTVWQKVTKDHAVSKAQDFNAVANGGKCNLAPAANGVGTSDAQPFALDIRKLDGKDNQTPVISLTKANNIDTTATFSQIRYLDDPSVPADVQGMWIQAVHFGSVAKTPGYYDFHIRACWTTPGQQTPVTLGTIVRLYDPAA